MAPGTTTGGGDRLAVKARSSAERNKSRGRRAGRAQIPSTRAGGKSARPDPPPDRRVSGRRRTLASPDAPGPCRGVSSARRQALVVGYVRSPCHDRGRTLRGSQLFGWSPTAAPSSGEDQAVLW